MTETATFCTKIETKSRFRWEMGPDDGQNVPFQPFQALQWSRGVSVEEFSLRENPEVYTTAAEEQCFQ